MNISQRLRTCAKHTGLDSVIELLQEAADEIDALQARAQVQGEPVYWEWRHLGNNQFAADFGQWSEWKRVEARNPIFTAEDELRTLRRYIADGYKYELRALHTAPQPAQATQTEVTMTDADAVQVYGVKDGVQTLIGSAPMPPHMKARELAREQFGHFEDGDGSDAELCFGALEQLIDHMERSAHRAILALRPQQSGLTGCNCRWDGDTQVQWCELHLAHKDAIHEWAERAKEAEKQLALRPDWVPMTDEQRQSAFLSAPTSSGGHRTAFMLGIQFAEVHHGITAQVKKEAE